MYQDKKVRCKLFINKFTLNTRNFAFNQEFFVKITCIEEFSYHKISGSVPVKTSCAIKSYATNKPSVKLLCYYYYYVFNPS